MFLTHMALDINRRETQELLKSQALLCLTVRAAFAGGNLVPLFRVDQIGSRQWLVILSRLRPSLYVAHERYGYLGVFPSWETFDYDDVIEDATEGSIWRFELNASPMGLCPVADERLLDETWLNRWLRESAVPNGFEVRSQHLMDRGWLEVDGKFLHYARWRGSLRVTDTQMFEAVSMRGLGVGQRWGEGLMTLSRTYGVAE